MLRFDRAPINSKHLTDEGFLNVRGIATRTGVFKYKNADGSVRRELRHPDDVLKSDSLNTMKSIPVTLLHPAEKVVTASNAKKVGVGFTGEDINHDGRLVDVNLKVTDQKAISTIEEGMQELSLGYSVEHVDEQGEFNGEKYDVRQTNIKYNHLAIVPAGRAGNEAKLLLDSNLVLDADDAIHFIDEENNINININKKKETDMNLVKVDLKGLSYDAAPEVKIALDEAVKIANDSKTSIATLNTEKTTLQANLDTAEETIEANKKVDNSDVIAKAVTARITLEREASKHLDSEIKIDGLSDIEIKKACIIKHFPSAETKLDGAEEAYINARFDSVLEIEVNEDGDHDDKKSGISNQRKSMLNKNDSGNKEIKMDAKSARVRMIDSLLNPHKSESK